MKEPVPHNDEEEDQEDQSFDWKKHTTRNLQKDQENLNDLDIQM